MIKIEEIVERIKALKKWLNSKPLDHYLYWQVKNEMLEYSRLNQLCIEQNLEEINNQVKSDYYQQLNQI